MMNVARRLRNPAEQSVRPLTPFRAATERQADANPPPMGHQLRGRKKLTYVKSAKNGSVRVACSWGTGCCRTACSHEDATTPCELIGVP